MPRFDVPRRYDGSHVEVLPVSDEATVDVVAAALTEQQMVVLQAVYDHFREHGTWPKFIAIDRPLRRAGRWDSAAIVQSLPESVIVPPRHGLRPVRDDELRLHLLGVEACEGGPEDTARLARLLRWLAEREEAYEPPADSDEDMPQVSSEEVAEYLGLTDESDRLSLDRLRVLLQLDHCSVTAGSLGDGWYARPGEDIWRFRDVQTAQDVVAARDAWIAEGRRMSSATGDAPPAAYYHVQLQTTPPVITEHVRYNLSADALESQILAPYREGRAIMSGGTAIQIEDISQIRIIQTDRLFGDIRRRPNSLIGALLDTSSGDWGTVVRYGRDVTDEFITEPPSQQPVQTADPAAVSMLLPAAPLYVDQQVIDAIRAKEGTSALNVTKLLKLIGELNDNYARRNTYASHTLLRGLLDHIPPILGQPHFDAVVSNYRWTKTDKKYLQQLAAFRAQGDDALHRQISADPDLLGFDDMPSSICVDRLLLECAKEL